VGGVIQGWFNGQDIIFGFRITYDNWEDWEGKLRTVLQTLGMRLCWIKRRAPPSQQKAIKIKTIEEAIKFIKSVFPSEDALTKPKYYICHEILVLTRTNKELLISVDFYYYDFSFSGGKRLSVGRKIFGIDVLGYDSVWLEASDEELRDFNERWRAIIKKLELKEEQLDTDGEVLHEAWREANRPSITRYGFTLRRVKDLHPSQWDELLRKALVRDLESEKDKERARELLSAALKNEISREEFRRRLQPLLEKARRSIKYA